MDRIDLVCKYLFKSRIDEYEEIIKKALYKGYTVCSVIESIAAFNSGCKKVMVLRHDVDHISPGFRKMIEVEKKYGVTSTYYFRWKTCNNNDIELTKREGHEVSLHFETLATVAKIFQINSKDQLSERILQVCADLLVEEINLFRSRYGVPVKTIAAHGAYQNRLIGYSNNYLFLIDPELRQKCGIDFEVYDQLFLEKFNVYISDVQWEVNDGYRYGIHPLDALDGSNRICFLSHPDHWGFSKGKRCRKILRSILYGRMMKQMRFSHEHFLCKQ